MQSGRFDGSGEILNRCQIVDRVVHEDGVEAPTELVQPLLPTRILQDLAIDDAARGAASHDLLHGGDVLRARAINDYYVDIPVSDAIEGGPIIAYKMNGDVMLVRNKGPLWVVYPYDENPEYRSEVIYSRSIWQLDRIEVIN